MPVTGLAADQLKLIMGKLDAILQKMWDQGVWVWPLLTVHNSVMIESEDKYAEEVLIHHVPSQFQDLLRGQVRGGGPGTD